MMGAGVAIDVLLQLLRGHFEGRTRWDTIAPLWNSRHDRAYDVATIRALIVAIRMLREKWLGDLELACSGEERGDE